MVIKSENDWEGENTLIEYHDSDSFEDLPRERCKQVYGVCFAGDKIVIGKRVRNGNWGLIGGSIEKGETFFGDACAGDSGGIQHEGARGDSHRLPKSDSA